MKEIQPLIIPILGTAKFLIVRVLAFDMTATTCDFWYGLLNQDESIILEGNLSMNENEFNNWGADNNYCISWAASKLGVILI